MTLVSLSRSPYSRLLSIWFLLYLNVWRIWSVGSFAFRQPSYSCYLTSAICSAAFNCFCSFFFSFCFAFLSRLVFNLLESSLSTFANASLSYCKFGSDFSYFVLGSMFTCSLSIVDASSILSFCTVGRLCFCMFGTKVCLSLLVF